MKVTIEIIRKTSYAKTVEMSKEDYQRLSDALDSNARQDRRAAEKEINEMIDEDDWQDDDLDNVDTFQTEEEE